MRIAVIRFPGSNCDLDVVGVLRDVLKAECSLVWHNDMKDEYDGVVLPGGFSYGDHLRSGIIAAYSPAMAVVREMAKEGKPVLGICNGFQILVEGGLLPGALLPNKGLKFICKWVGLRIESDKCLFTKGMKGNEVEIPIAHNDGLYFADKETIKELRDNERVILTYTHNPNGSINDIAGICSQEGNVLGLMPHPERASIEMLGGTDGKGIFENMIKGCR